jgi:hypothetical protein
MTNVPQAVWIDEGGQIVRPPETAGSHDGWRSMNREDMSMPDQFSRDHRNGPRDLYERPARLGKKRQRQQVRV